MVHQCKARKVRNHKRTHCMKCETRTGLAKDSRAVARDFVLFSAFTNITCARKGSSERATTCFHFRCREANNSNTPVFSFSLSKASHLLMQDQIKHFEEERLMRVQCSWKRKKPFDANAKSSSRLLYPWIPLTSDTAQVTLNFTRTSMAVRSPFGCYFPSAVCVCMALYPQGSTFMKYRCTSQKDT